MTIKTPTAIEPVAVPSSAPVHIPKYTFGDFHVGKQVIELAGQHFPHFLSYLQIHRKSFAANKTFYLRDLGVLRADGRLLVPYSIQNRRVHDLVRSLAFYPRIDLQDKESSGKGFYSEKQKANFEDSIVESYFIQQGITCIEGGNVFLFKGKDGKMRAIIGDHAVILSFIALTEQYFFEEHQEELDKLRFSIEEPSDEFVRMARNFFVHTEQLPHFEKGQELFNFEEAQIPKYLLISQLDSKERAAFAKTLLAPVSPLDRVLYRASARELQARFQMTKTQIAEELQVEPQHLCIYQQSRFHIDFELSVDSASGLVYLQSKEATIQALNEMLALQPTSEAWPMDATPVLAFIPDKLPEKFSGFAAYYPTPPSHSAACHTPIPETNIRKLHAKYTIMSHAFCMTHLIEEDSETYLTRRASLVCLENNFLKHLKYYNYLKEMANIYEAQNRQAIAQATGFEVVPVPGMFEIFESEKDLPNNYTFAHNFLNGIYFRAKEGTPIFVTNGGDSLLEKSFVDYMAKVNPKLRILFVQNMELYLTNLRAGVHCMTRETFTYLLS